MRSPLPGSVTCEESPGFAALVADTKRPPVGAGGRRVKKNRPIAEGLMAEAKRGGGPVATGHIVGAKASQSSPHGQSGPLVDWEEVKRFLEEIGRPRWREPLILTAFPPEPGKPNIHMPGDLGEAHRREVERTLEKIGRAHV